MNGRVKRRSSSRICIGAIVVVSSLGCRINTEIQRRSIDELYGDAIAAAAVRPAAVQPAFPAVSSGQLRDDNALVDSVNDQDGPTIAVFPLRDSKGAGRSKEWVETWIRDDDGQNPSFTSDAPVVDVITDNSALPVVSGPTAQTPQWTAPSSIDPIGLVGNEDASLDASARFQSEPLEPKSTSKSLPSRIASPLTSLASTQNRDDSMPRMTDMFDQTDIFEVIQILSTHFRVPIIADDTIGGVVTATVEDETLDAILTKILLPLGLIHAEHEGRYIIAPPDPTSPLFTYIAKRATYSPSNHNVVSLVTLLPSRYRNFIQTSPERNLAVIEAPERLLKEITTRLVELDTPIGQVELEAIVCVVSPDSGFRFGLDWNHVVGVDDAQSLKIGLAGLAMSGSASKNGVQDAFSDFAVTSAFMRLLAQEGYITIRAAPRVTARDGEKASISLNRETFFSLQPDASNVFFRQDVQKVEAGISLEIVPRIHGDMIAVEIAKAEVSEDIRSSSNADVSSNPFPIINRRVVSTKVNVRDGNTIVIGGLVQRQTVDKINRVPGLSGLPGIGKLFQSVEKQEQDVEVAVFISPRIVPSDPNICLP